MRLICYLWASRALDLFKTGGQIQSQECTEKPRVAVPSEKKERNWRRVVPEERLTRHTGGSGPADVFRSRNERGREDTSPIVVRELEQPAVLPGHVSTRCCFHMSVARIPSACRLNLTVNG